MNTGHVYCCANIDQVTSQAFQNPSSPEKNESIERYPFHNFKVASAPMILRFDSSKTDGYHILKNFNIKSEKNN